MICLDANILVYSVDPAGTTKRVRALDLIQRSAGVAAVTEQTLFEFAHVSMRKLGMPRDQAIATVRGFTQTFIVVLPQDDIVERTLHLMSAYKINVWDARLLAACNRARVGTLLSEDLQDGGKYGSVTVINPFDATNAAIVDTLLLP